MDTGEPLPHMEKRFADASCLYPTKIWDCLENKPT